MDQPLATEEQKPIFDGKDRKQSNRKFVKPERHNIDTGDTVIVHGIDKFNYDQIKIVSKSAKESDLKLIDFVFDTEIEPNVAQAIIDSAILRVFTTEDGKHHVLSGRNKVRAAMAEELRRVKAHVVSINILNKTMVQPKHLSQEELAKRLKSGVLLTAAKRTGHG